MRPMNAPKHAARKIAAATKAGMAYGQRYLTRLAYTVTGTTFESESIDDSPSRFCRCEGKDWSEFQPRVPTNMLAARSVQMRLGIMWAVSGDFDSSLHLECRAILVLPSKSCIPVLLVLEV